MSRFNFTGKVKINSLDSRYPSFREGVSKGGNKYKSITLFINAAENNSAVIELFGMKVDEIKTKDTNGNDLTIDWDDRKDKEIVDSVANYRKNVIQIGEDNSTRQAFVSSYDAVGYIWENIDELKGKNVTATGTVQPQEYNGQISDKFQMQNLYVVSDDKKPALNIKSEIYLNRDSMDLDEFKSDKVIAFNVYTKEWMSKEKPDAYIPKKVMINCKKVDFDNPDHVKLFNGRWLPIGLKYEKGKVVCSLKSNKMYSMMADIRFQNGATETDFDESQLTEMQKSMISLGLKTIDDFKPKGSIYGNRVTEYRWFDCDISGETYNNGAVMLDDSIEEFEEKIYSVAADNEDEVEDGFINEPEEEEEKPKKKTTNKTEKKTEPEPEKDQEDDEDSDLDSLFD